MTLLSLRISIARWLLKGAGYELLIPDKEKFISIDFGKQGDKAMMTVARKQKDGTIMIEDIREVDFIVAKGYFYDN